MGTGEFNAGDNPARTSIPSRGEKNTSCYRNRDKLRPGRPHLARMQTLPMMLIVIFREFATA